MSGQLTYHLSGTHSHFINVCENLDWKRQFGIHLWLKEKFTFLLNLDSNFFKELIF